MMKKLVTTLCLLLLSSVVFAQTKDPLLTETAVDPVSGLTAQYPSDWYNIPLQSNEQGGLKLANQAPNTLSQGAIKPGEMGVEIIPPQQLVALVGDGDFEDAWGIIAERAPGEPDDVVDVEDYPSRARFLTSAVEDYTISVGLVELDEGVYALLLGTTHPDTVEEALPIYYAIAGNLSITTTITNTIFANTLTFTNEAETLALAYPDASDWTAYEDGSSVVITNTRSLEDFSADKGEYLIVVNATSADKADQSALFGAMLPLENFAFPIPPFLINADGSENTDGATLEGLVGKQAGDDVAVAAAIVAPESLLPGVSISGGSQMNSSITTEANLVAMIKVYGAPGEEDAVQEILNIVAHSLHVPLDLSDVEPSSIDLSETLVEGQITIHYPEGWDSYLRGGINVAGIPEGTTDSVRLIMSARNLEAGESAEDALHSFVAMFGYDTFDTLTLTDGRTVYIGAPFQLNEAVLAVEYNENIVITMSLLPNNPDDFMKGLPIALAILEAFEIDL